MLSAGQILVFRHDRFSFTYEGWLGLRRRYVRAGDAEAFSLQAWIMTGAPSSRVRASSLCEACGLSCM